MKLTPLVPAPPEEGTGPRWGLAASALGHGALILALLAVAIRQLPPDGSPSPSYDLVFQGPSSGAPPTPAPKTQQLPPAQPADLAPPPDAILGPPAPTPLTTPDPTASTSPPPAADTAPPPVPDTVPDTVPPTPSPAPAPAPTQVQAAPSAAAPPPVAPAAPDEAASIPLPTPIETPPTAEPPAVRLELPPTEAAPATQALIMPQPPPPLPPIQQPPPQPPIQQPPPQPPRPVTRQAPRSAFGTLSNPMNLSLAPSAPRPAARGAVASRSLDLSPPQAHDGPASSDPYAQIRAANASADWNRGLLQYWLQHRFYPEQARVDGEQGSVTIQLTVNRSGRVESVEVVSRSGSQWLDMAALATWRNARLPPFTNEMREDRITFPIPIQYTLIR